MTMTATEMDHAIGFAILRLQGQPGVTKSTLDALNEAAHVVFEAEKLWQQNAALRARVMELQEAKIDRVI